jgi:hypothetical protein
MKDLRTRRADELAVDLDGPRGWNRGSAWDEERPLHRAALELGDLSRGARPR